MTSCGVGIGLKMDMGVGESGGVRLFFTTAIDARNQPRFPPGLLLGKDPIEYFGGLRSVRLQMLTNRHTCWEGLLPQNLFTWICAGVLFCPTSVALPVMAAQS
jgi:hypothetical protein